MADNNVVAIGIGHNQPPEEIADPLDPEVLRARFLADNAALFEKLTELEQGVPQVPAVIPDEKTAKRLVNYVAKQCGTAIADLKKAHTEAKKPFLAITRMFDDVALRRIDRFVLAVAPPRKAGEDWLRRKEIEQRRQEEERRRQAVAAAHQAEVARARLAAEAQKKLATGDRPAASKLQTQADEAADLAARETRIAEAPAAPVIQHTDEGASLYFVAHWAFEVEELGNFVQTDPKGLPANYWMPDEEAIQAAVDRGERDIPGCSIYEKTETRYRRC